MSDIDSELDYAHYSDDQNYKALKTTIDANTI
jgi:hypothetical protein